MVKVLVVVGLSLLIKSEIMSKPILNSEYIEERKKILNKEETSFVGGNIQLTDKEKKVNGIILAKKKKELAYKNISECLYTQHFFQVKAEIEKSEVFSIIKSIPKGASLHTHMLAGVSLDYIMENFTRRKHLYGSYVNGTFKLKFFDNAPSTWKSLEEYRKENSSFDEFLHKQLTLEVKNPQEFYPTANDVWIKFKKIFSTMYDMICYRAVFEDYIYELLHELYKDNVFYTELKGTFMPLYELNGTIYDTESFFKILKEIIDKFKQHNPKFVGLKYIHSVYRGVEKNILEDGLEKLLRLKEIYPELIAGFDFVGYEEEGHNLAYYSDELLKAKQKNMNFYFHAGETNWYGHTDLNILDAMLLNTSRLGHAFALSKHPELIKLGKERKIPIELCPISNQVLMLIDDLRNHPAVPLLSINYPVVIGNDDPAYWGSTGLSYDWYVTFMAMTPKHVGIGFLKELAMNSIVYSSMGIEEKNLVMKNWENEWNLFLDEMLTNF